MDKIKFIHYFVTLLIIYSVLQFSREPESVEFKFLEEVKVIDNEEEIIVEKKKKSSNVLNKLLFIIIPLLIILFFIMLKIFSPTVSSLSNDSTISSPTFSNHSEISSNSSRSSSHDNYYQNSPIQQSLSDDSFQSVQNQYNTPYSNIDQLIHRFKRLRLDPVTLFLYGNYNQNSYYLNKKIERIVKYLKKNVNKNVVVKHIDEIENDEKIEHIFIVSIPVTDGETYYKDLFTIVDKKKHPKGATVYYTDITSHPRLQNPSVLNLNYNYKEEIVRFGINYKKIN